MAIAQIAAVLIILFVLLTSFRQYLVWIVLAIILYFVIRFIADIFWWGRDNDRW